MLFFSLSIIILISFIYEPLITQHSLKQINILNKTLILYKLNLLKNDPYFFKLYNYPQTFVLIIISVIIYKYPSPYLFFIVTSISFIQYLMQYNFFYLNIIDSYLSSHKSFNQLLLEKEYSISRINLFKNTLPEETNLLLQKSMNPFYIKALPNTSLFIGEDDTLYEFYYIDDTSYFDQVSISLSSFYYSLYSEINLSKNITKSFFEAISIIFILFLSITIDFSKLF